jgi:hypothetical protein
MAYKGVDLAGVAQDLGAYLTQYGQVLNTAFNTYAQRFEAYCFLEEIRRLKAAGLAPVLRNPGGAKYVVLKFYTRGRPSKYSHAEFGVRGEAIEMHHNLKVRSFHAGLPGATDPEPGFHLDLAFIRADSIVEDKWVSSEDLLSFVECKHMPAFPELIASFLGLVHEVMPRYLFPKRASWFTRRCLRRPTLMTSRFPSIGARSVWKTVSARGLSLGFVRYDPVSRSLIDEL